MYQFTDRVFYFFFWKFLYLDTIIFEADERKTSNSKYDVCANRADPSGPKPSCYWLYAEQDVSIRNS